MRVRKVLISEHVRACWNMFDPRMAIDAREVFQDILTADRHLDIRWAADRTVKGSLGHEDQHRMSLTHEVIEGVPGGRIRFGRCSPRNFLDYMIEGVDRGRKYPKGRKSATGKSRKKLTDEAAGR